MQGIFASIHASHPPSSPWKSDPASGFWYAPAGWTDAFSETGIAVTPEIAMTISAVWSGINFLGRNVGSFPCQLHERIGEKGRRRATDHPLYELLRWQPNSWQTSVEFWEMAVGHLFLRGNFYAFIDRDFDGLPMVITPIHPDRVRAKRLDNGRIQYQVLTGFESEFFSQDQIFHVRGFMSDGVTGLSLVAVAARSLGAIIAADSFAARFFKQGSAPAFAVSHPTTLGDDAKKSLRKNLSGYLTGLRNAHGIFILEEGMTVEKLGVEPEKAQLLTTREHSVREVARWLGLPRQVFADVGSDTFASVEAYGTQLKIYAFRPLVTRFEQAIRRDLIVDQKKFFATFLMDDLARGDLKTRTDSYQKGIMGGWLTRNEARERDNLEPGPPELDIFLEPLNMQQAGADPEEDEKKE